MAGPITWRNVNGGSFDGANRLLAGGQDQIMGATDTILRTLDQYRKVDANNAAVTKDVNTQDFLDRVASMSIDQLASPEGQAQVAQARLQAGNGIDRSVARNAVPERLSQLQTAAAKNQQYTDMTQEVAQRPVLEDLAAKLYSGDTAGYNKILDTQNLRNEDKLRGALVQRQDDLTNQGYRAAGEQRAIQDQQMQVANNARAIQSHELSQQLGRASLANTNEERKYRADTREIAQSAEIIKAVAAESSGKLAAVEAGNPYANPSKDVPKDAKDILNNAGIVDKKGDGEFDTWFGSNARDRQKMQEGVTSMLSTGVPATYGGKTVNVPIPPAMLDQYLQSVKGKAYITGSPEKDMQEHFINLMKREPELAARAVEGIQARKEHNKLISQLSEVDKELRLSKNPKLSSTLDNINKLRGNAFQAPASDVMPSQAADTPTQWPPKKEVTLY